MTSPQVLLCGEVRTCLLPNLRALDARSAAELLRLRGDTHVRVSERPIPYALSPEILTGVDCRLPTSNGARVRAVGTVTARAALTEGRLLQAGAYVGVQAAGPDVRRPWGHYLMRPGVLEPFGKLPARAVAEGVLEKPGQGELDLGMIAEALLGQLRRSPRLDLRAPLESRPTHLRWTALRAAGEPTLVRFTLAEEGLRTVELRLPPEIPAAAAAGLCEDLALHDWLLTTVVPMLDRDDFGAAATHLLHLWMPAAHVDPALRHLWDALERDPGFSRQWQTLVQRITLRRTTRAD